MAWYDVISTPVGDVFVGGSARGVHRIEFVRDHRNGAPGHYDVAHWTARVEGDAGQPAAHDAEAARGAIEELREYFAGARDVFTFALTPVGSDWQRAVWRELETIPYGTTTTYGAIARKLGRPNASRAVGASVGRNPIAIVVPCHRVVGGDGTLTGYAGGLDRKRWLLDHEWSTAARGGARASAVLVAAG
ncbi:MAG: methylated-DNA--[protein]-cysteine S-methyltransferase [Dehalococcoidia bacterium]|nr:methylated-DNA--[protein]-cysteine S-methyltransferase [Dehalococcoidia bacterium]